MLTHLIISDFAVVEQAELAFGPGMTVISGETGAGKSLLVDALGFIAGQRADAGMVRHGAERAELLAEFSLADARAAHEWLREQEMDDGDTCQLRRVLRADGGSKAWINGRMASASQLAELATHLLEIHGQHAQQSLLSRPAQLTLLDAFGRHAPLLQALAEATRHWQGLQHEWNHLNRQGDVGERMDFLRHQLQELDAESLEAESLAQLDAEHRRQAHGSELLAANANALALLAEADEANARNLILRARDLLGRVLAHEPRLAEVDAALEAAGIALDEATDTLSRLGDDLELDPARFDELEARLQRLHALARKHRVEMEELLPLRERLREELTRLENAEHRLAGLQTEIDHALADWQQIAERLGQARQLAAQTLSEATCHIIRELGMGQATFLIELQTEADSRPNLLGSERAEFLIAANPGQPPRPLRKVASGGELSRISLAIEVASSAIAGSPTMIFDEVDTGISGAVAEVVGHKLRALGERVQVMCVTHLPQVAAQGHQQWRVKKSSSEQVTASAVEVLDENGRIEEIARLLGGVKITAAVRDAARSLLARHEG